MQNVTASDQQRRRRGAVRQDDGSGDEVPRQLRRPPSPSGDTPESPPKAGQHCTLSRGRRAPRCSPCWQDRPPGLHNPLRFSGPASSTPFCSGAHPFPPSLRTAGEQDGKGPGPLPKVPKVMLQSRKITQHRIRRWSAQEHDPKVPAPPARVAPGAGMGQPANTPLGPTHEQAACRTVPCKGQHRCLAARTKRGGSPTVPGTGCLSSSRPLRRAGRSCRCPPPVHTHQPGESVQWAPRRSRWPPASICRPEVRVRRALPRAPLLPDGTSPTCSMQSSGVLPHQQVSRCDA